MQNKKSIYLAYSDHCACLFSFFLDRILDAHVEYHTTIYIYSSDIM